MSSGLYTWSQTAASNASADSTINWVEGQAPSSINDSARAVMAGIAKYRDDIAGAIVTGGTSTAYTVTSYSIFDTLAHLSGQMIAFTPNATSANAMGADVTLNVDSLGAKPIRMQPSVPLPSGTLILGTPYVVTYNNTDGVFYLQNMTNPYQVPLAAGMPYFGVAAPNSAFAFPFGQAISRTTYATLFAQFNTNFGSGDGSTTFNLPDLRGRVLAGYDSMGGSAAGRLTSTSGLNTLWATGGAETHTLTTGEMPAHTHASYLVDPGHLHSFIQGSNSGSANQPAAANTTSTGGTGSTGTATTGMTIFNASAGSGSPHLIVPPSIVCNYILRVI